MANQSKQSVRLV